MPWNLVTQHHKEQAIFPVLRKNGIDQTSVLNADTDQLGTFSGEIPRILSIEQTLLEKCKLVSNQFPTAIFLATEGSFGPHPVIPWISHHQESFLLWDRSTDAIFFHHFNSNSTNFQVGTIRSKQQLVEFCSRSKFPSHAIILKSTQGNHPQIYKGLQNWEEVFEIWDNSNGELFAETDMRAMYNPTRMANIRIGFSAFLENLQKECPKCAYPGFFTKDVELGLPCQWCNLPTQSILFAIHRCEHCSLEEKEKHPLGKSHEDPMYCSNCNP